MDNSRAQTGKVKTQRTIASVLNSKIDKRPMPNETENLLMQAGEALLLGYGWIF